MKVISVSLPNLVQSGEQKTDGAGATNTDPALTIDPDSTRRRPLMPYSIIPHESNKSDLSPLSRMGVR